MSNAGANSSEISVQVAHVFVVAALATAAFMLSTAAELGPMGPLIIAEGFYLGAFAGLVELALAIRSALKMIARRAERRPAAPAEAP